MADEQPVDPLSPPSPEAPHQELEVDQAAVRRMRNMLLIFFGIPYMGFIVWCCVLMAMFPNPQGEMESFMRFGVLSCGVAFGVFSLIGIVALLRIGASKVVAQNAKVMSLLRIFLFLLPGIGFAAATPFAIMKEPPIFIQIVEPTDPQGFVAPLSITFSLEESMKILQKRNLRGVSYAWDFDGDGQPNDETVVPRVSAYYERPGIYNFVARARLSDGSYRRVTRPFRISNAVFSTDPQRAIVDEPVRFSVAHLLTEEVELTEVQWDFNDDGEFDAVTDQAEVVHIFYTIGPKDVRAVVKYGNQKQDDLRRTIEIFEPDPPPFPISIKTEPEKLISPPPFGTFFSVETDEPLKEVSWDFGDGEASIGERVGHTFDRRGNFVVKVEARSESGEIAKLTKVVQVTQPLRLGDLRFNGEPEVSNNKTITGEVPVTLNLTPVTNVPLIEFFWEAPDATVVGSKDTTLQAIYRREGTYTVTLLAHDPDGSAARIPITLEVTPPSSQISIFMNPEGGTAPLSVRFDASETVIPDEEITGFEWVFGEADDIERGRNIEVQHGGAQIEYLFRNPGTYQVLLRARTTSGKEYEGSKTIVVRAPVLDACFTASRTVGTAPMGVGFDMSCTAGNPKTVEWDFGDGSTTDERSPSHYFENPGTYDVQLRLTDNAGSISTYFLQINAQ